MVLKITGKMAQRRYWYAEVDRYLFDPTPVLVRGSDGREIVTKKLTRENNEK